MSLEPDVLTDFLSSIRVIDTDATSGMISLSSPYADFIDRPEKMIVAIVSATLDELFSRRIITGEHFAYDASRNSYIFNNECLSLEWSSVRNLLVSCGFLEVRLEGYRPIFGVSTEYEQVLGSVTQAHHRKMTLENLRARVLADEEAGELAEQYVLAYEERRINNPDKASRVKRISMIDVCAGYDIISFEGADSDSYDRFVEVKAVSKNNGFYWSKNELDAARLNGSHYHLCLVDLGKIGDCSYEPYVVTDPATVLTDSEEWLLEPQSYFVQQVFRDCR
ncbi:MAG: protein NO VEIN domain-containing protein [Candidatus Cryosericum sp.]